MNILRRIQYSRIGKVLFKKGPLLEMARVARRIVIKKKQEFDERYSKKTNLLELVRDNFCNEAFNMPETDEIIDIIVPIYNGYEYLTKLFADLRRTTMRCRVILVDDHSPDEKVRELERAYASECDNVILIENEENVGFVKTVNRGLKEAKGHVVLVNTDTELPTGWLERLMYPILFEKKVGTTTPYTNSGTIFSFPNMGVNNLIYRGLDVETIDAYFSKVKPRYISAPTGVGFCMGMNKYAIAEIGLLDDETYGRGYGEENDWCQRALKKGYRNVQVENLFVYHKHGGSFLSDEKKRLIQEHTQALIKRFPKYDMQVGNFVRKDLNRDIRHLMQMVIDTNETTSVLCFDHSLGGGATSYLEKKKKEAFQEEICTTTVRYDYIKGIYNLDFENGEISNTYEMKNFEDLLFIGKWLHWDEIWVNELVSYPKIWDKLKTIENIKEQQSAKLVMLAHDYFAVCPSANLATDEHKYCELPGGEKCQKCYDARKYQEHFECESQTEWVEHWKDFFNACTEIRTFSEDTYQRMKTVFGENFSYTVVPHQVNYMFPIEKSLSTSRTITIGLMGNLIYHKGSALIEEMLQVIEEKNLDIRIVLIGKVVGTSIQGYANFYETGEYHVSDLPKLVYEHEIDIFLISSIIPETFSYTTSEAMEMRMPVATLNIGAPAERVKTYDKGIVLSSDDATTVLNEISDFVVNRLKLKEHIVPKKKVIYIAEYMSFSSRYRLEHLQEELLYMGVSGELWDTKDIPDERNWDEIDAVVIYRCRDLMPLTALIDEIKTHGIRILYDIDDYVFEYDEIKNLSFMMDDGYQNFDKYSADICKCMEKCDAFITSTKHMRQAIERRFPEKPIYVNRNVASAKMVICSLLAYETRKESKDKVVLGYFSGSSTHSRDFDLIKDVLVSIMKQRENAYLKIVGCLELPEIFHDVADRCIYQGFQEWTKLPEVIAECDINLMPLEDTFFHRCKSENKWMEAAFVKVPTIASSNPELEGAMKNGENAILCKDTKEWETQLLHLIDNEEERKRIAEAAFDYVMKYKHTLSVKDGLKTFVCK